MNKLCEFSTVVTVFGKILQFTLASVLLLRGSFFMFYGQNSTKIEFAHIVASALEIRLSQKSEKGKFWHLVLFVILWVKIDYLNIYNYSS